VGGDTRNPYLERFIHGEIYRIRPDVQAIVHSHSPSVIPFAASSARLRPIYHMSGFLTGETRVFDIRHKFGCTDMLVRNRDHGAALAAELGTKGVVLMRGHGFVACGPSIPVAVYRAVYTEKNADLQQRAITLGGEVTYLDDFTLLIESVKTYHFIHELISSQVLTVHSTYTHHYPLSY
jgi:ribulose-5-phosphate 4-epimerase/fuculose-1-phosphate aldolase